VLPCAIGTNHETKPNQPPLHKAATHFHCRNRNRNNTHSNLHTPAIRDQQLLSWFMQYCIHFRLIIKRTPKKIMVI
jgi:hypothetical protein